EETEKIKYIFTDKVYSNLEHLSIVSSLIDICLDFEGTKLNVPNLKHLDLEGIASLQYFQNMNDNFIFAPKLKEVYLIDTEVTQLPAFIKNTKSLRSLQFRHGNLLEISNEIFEMEKLQKLSFEYCKKIRIVPDTIRKLINLVHFDLWEASIEYLSPELFLLPNIRSINLTYSEYTPTREVLDALKIFKDKKQNRFEGFNTSH
ncbi:MAG: hypothetical protein WCI71_07950, partial [Bacteroidota bacterium]